MLERFSLIFASVSYECDVPVFAKWLAGGGIPPLREERERADGALIIVGGAISYINPLSLAAIADVIVLGDGVELTTELVRILRSCGSRAARLALFAEHSSFFVPAIHGADPPNVRLTVSKTSDINADPGISTWISPRSVFGSTLLVELQRGCARRCKYCTLPSCFAPFRQADIERITALIGRAAEAADFDRIGLITPEAGDYRHLDRLLDVIDTVDKGVSFASLRVDGLSERMISAVIKGGRRSLTIAPEAGREALRRECGKDFSNDMIVEKIKMARALGAINLKMYFMIGLPGEDDEDVRAIYDLCLRVRAETGISISASVSPFIPKPRTAWALEAFCGERELKRRIDLLRGIFKTKDGMKLRVGGIREAALEYLVSWSGIAGSKIIAEETDSSEAGLVRSLEGALEREAVSDALRMLG